MILDKFYKFYKLNKDKRFFFDFFTNWNIYLFIFCNLFYYESNLLIASRTGVLICSTLGSLIIILKGKSACPGITKHIYTYESNFEFTPKNILIIDILAHGLPLFLVINSKPIENFEYCPKTIITQYSIFSFCFIIFQKFRNISISITYNLCQLRTNTYKMILCIFVYFISILPISINPIIIHSGWKFFYINQFISSFIMILLYYYFLYIFKEL